MHHRSGFTLIELSIVLVIIGLIVGGVLVGQDLINVAAIRAQISQIERFNTAVATFRGKYGCLPGDCMTAAQFGFAARGTWPGTGDGNEVIEGAVCGSGGSCIQGSILIEGETVLFWEDLSQATLIPGNFSTGQAQTGPSGTVSGNTSISLYLPEAKVGKGLYVYAYSGDITQVSCRGYINYFGLSAITQLNVGGGAAQPTTTTPGLSVIQASVIDQKIDDGLPQSGRVTTIYDNSNCGPVWVGASDTSATLGSSTTCYDNSNVAGAQQKYSMSQNSGSGRNCALSFVFQ